MMAFVQSGWGKGLILALAAILLLGCVAFALHRGSPAQILQEVKRLLVSVFAALVIGFAAGLRGSRELERPWSLPQIGTEEPDTPKDDRAEWFSVEDK